jgi:hypothetical protein
MTLEKWITFIKAHERLIVICIVAFVLFRAGQGIENMFVRYDDHKAQQAASQVVTDTNANKTLTDQIAQLKADSEQHNLVIDQEIKTAISGLAKQQQIDSQATQQQILDRWKLLLPLKPGAVQSNGNTDTITPEAATQTVQALEEIPALKLQVSDLSAKLITDDGIIGAQDSLIVGLNKQIVDEKASREADVKLEKAKAKRSWFRGFKVGIIVGSVGTEAIRVWAGKP